MVELPKRPSVWVVAVAASRPKRAFVLIIFLVTRPTLNWGVLICGAPMALLAWRCCMEADQRESGEAVVELDLAAPRDLVVALFATASLLALVNVVLLVTRVARHRDLARRSVGLVAVLTRRLCVCAAKRELRFLAVVECRLLPASRVVTRLALRAVGALMRIVFLVAADASQRQLCRRAATRVARIAGDLRVPT